MGRVFEKRKYTIFKRNAKMAKTFTRISKDIMIACRMGIADPALNSRLRVVIQNAKAANMPKANIDAALARATNKDEKDLEELVYEGYGPYGGVAILVETATDNPMRTVANVRMYFTRSGGTLGKTGSLDFIFTRKAIFEIDAANRDVEALELELIDFGLEEIEQADDKLFLYVPFAEFGSMQKALEDKGITVISAETIRIPNAHSESLTNEQRAEIEKLIDKMEDDDDVQAVYHNLKED
ncbi:MAG: YebC/PmpR family DNA-binding transcriptional regulator [Cytophagales bacterium]|nr:YebC/PmpR family DNA-binding transcriptional regulator [Cytophaga sp.]